MSQRGRTGLLLFYLVFTASRGFANLIVPLYFVEVGVPIIGVGIAIGVFGVSILLFEILWGVLLDRKGPRWLVLAAAVITAATYAAMPLIRTSEGAIVTEFALGISAPIPTLVIRSSLVSENESAHWAGGFGVIGAAYAVAQLTGSFLSAVSAPTVGLVDSFYVASGLAVASFFVFLRSAPSMRARVTPMPVPAMTRERQPRPRLDWRGLPLLGLVAIPNFITFAFFTNIIQLVVVRTPAISGSEFEAGLVVSSFWLSTAIFQPLLSWRGGKNARLWIGLALLASFGVYALMTQFYQVWEVAIGALLAGACYSAISPLSLSLLMFGIPKSYVGRAMGFYGAAEDIGVILGPLVGSAVWVEFGLTQAYLTLGATFLIVLIPYAISMRRPTENPTDKSPPPPRDAR